MSAAQVRRRRYQSSRRPNMGACPAHSVGCCVSPTGVIHQITGERERYLTDWIELVEAVDALLDDEGATANAFANREERIFRYADWNGKRLVGLPEFLAFCVDCRTRGLA